MSKMYPERAGNIAAFRGCFFSCIYCDFGRMLKLSHCDACRTFTPHSHLESLGHKPPKPPQNSFVSIGLSSDISLMSKGNFWQVLEYCRQWGDRTFLIQSKNPEYFLGFQNSCAKKVAKNIPDNVILATTIETNRGGWICDPVTTNPTPLCCKYETISKAPAPEKRYEAMLKLSCRTAVTCEPLLNFDIEILEEWICNIKPEILYIGYCNDGHDGMKMRLPEPELQKTHALIDRLRRNTFGTEIRVKTLRKAWWE